MLRLAVLYQSKPPPVVEGSRKPMKEGGYSDSGADIAFALQKSGVNVVTKKTGPDPTVDYDWVYGDDLPEIDKAIEAGANCFWLNTVLHGQHAILTKVGEGLAVVGQDPVMVEHLDNKFAANRFLRNHGLPVIKSKTISLAKLDYLEFGHAPLVIKPIRGRGSQGVMLVEDQVGIDRYRRMLEHDNPFGDTFMVEKYLPGVEITVSVMPKGHYLVGGERKEQSGCWCLPAVVRENHVGGVTPYNGVQAVVQNSHVADSAFQNSTEMAALANACARAGDLLAIRSVMRIDCRANSRGQFQIFDVNLKPNMTGMGRPGREDQDSLTTMAARALGWDYPMLLQNLLAQRWLLS